MRRWQSLLELLLQHAPIAVLLCWSFYLGRLGGLSLGVCCFLLPWPWLAKDRTVLGDDSQQLGPSLLILEHFFSLSVGLELDTKWVGLAKSFGPTIYNLNTIDCLFLYFVNSLKKFVRILLGIKCKLFLFFYIYNYCEAPFFYDSFILNSLVFVLNNSLRWIFMMWSHILF